MGNKPWCYDRVEDYDLDSSSPTRVLAACTACLGCSRLWTCRAAAADAIATGEPPRSQVLGGVAYGHDGKPRDSAGIARYYAARKPAKPTPTPMPTPTDTTR